MSSQKENEQLQNLVLQSLDASGVLSNIKAQVRSSIFQIMNNQNQKVQKQNGFQLENPISKKLQELPNALQTLELIQEFLEFFQMNYTLSIFTQESNLKDFNNQRPNLQKKLGLNNSDPEKPLLTHIISNFFKGETAKPLKKEEPKPEPKKTIKQEAVKPEPIKKEEPKQQILNQKPGKGSLLGALPSFNNKPFTSNLPGLNTSNQTSSYEKQIGNFTGASKDPYAFDLNEQKQTNNLNQTMKNKQPPVSNIQNNYHKQEMEEESLQEEIEEDLGDQDDLYGSSEKNVLKQSEEIVGASQSQGFDMTVDSMALEEYDYLEDVRD